MVLGPGWADGFGKNLSEKLTEDERVAATGLRRRFRHKNWGASESSLRGSRKGKGRHADTIRKVLAEKDESDEE